uniref:Uncharacterized protein n=1 Tax=Siphoviridae sp. ct4Z13 TaxID=2827778 RepID=A0A8S5SBI2_9CAUD|nr:MAG TPA: hypothetical protein [Siphoviridae sp. ct4Z13]
MIINEFLLINFLFLSITDHQGTNLVLFKMINFTILGPSL